MRYRTCQAIFDCTAVRSGDSVQLQRSLQIKPKASNRSIKITNETASQMTQMRTRCFCWVITKVSQVHPQGIILCTKMSVQNSLCNLFNSCWINSSPDQTGKLTHQTFRMAIIDASEGCMRGRRHQYTEFHSLFSNTGAPGHLWPVKLVKSTNVKLRKTPKTQKLKALITYLQL